VTQHNIPEEWFLISYTNVKSQKPVQYTASALKLILTFTVNSMTFFFFYIGPGAYAPDALQL
jgi:hypothetical protein